MVAPHWRARDDRRASSGFPVSMPAPAGRTPPGPFLTPASYSRGLDASRGDLYTHPMADELAAAQDAITRALEGIERLYAFAAWTIASIADPDQAFRVATDFAARARAVHDEQETKLRKLRAT